jgi:DNA-binding NtrC family response regulator
MLCCQTKMPTVFIIARDWTLRAALRAELREHGIDARGMESADEAGRAVASGLIPSVVVLEAVSEIASHPAIEGLIERVPAILIASRSETVPLPPVQTVLYRPVRIGEIAARVGELIRRGHAA